MFIGKEKVATIQVQLLFVFTDHWGIFFPQMSRSEGMYYRFAYNFSKQNLNLVIRSTIKNVLSAICNDEVKLSENAQASWAVVEPIVVFNANFSTSFAFSLHIPIKFQTLAS
jgi:hypothetical protein